MKKLTICLTLMLMLLFVSGCTADTNNTESFGKDPTTLVQNELTVPAEKDPEVLSDELVSDAFSDYGIRNNSYPSHYLIDGSANYYRIPQINISGKDASETNAIIYNDLYHGVYEKIEKKRGDCGISGITYAWTEHNGVISILARWAPEDDTGHGPIYYNTYNASSKTGKLLSTEEVAEKYKMTLDEYYALVKKQISDYCVEAAAPAEYRSPDFDEILDEMTSPDALQNAMPYIDLNGNLCCVAKVYYDQVQEVHKELLNLTGDTTPEPPAFSWDIPEENYSNDELVQNDTQPSKNALNISEDEAYDMACAYWNHTKGDVDEETGFELSVKYDGFFEGSNGNHYYAFRLLWWVVDHSSTIDYLYINAETGECSYNMSSTPTATQATKATELTSLEYWIEHCDDQFFAQEDLETFDKSDCRIARNAVYAKSGRKFKDASLQTYFSQFNWYHPTISPDSFSNSILNNFQSHNLNLIIAYEESRGYR